MIKSMVPPLPSLLDLGIDRLFPALLDELAFADSWPVGEVGDSPVFICAADFEAPWEWSLVLEGEKKCVYDLAAGFHSLPDDQMDDLFAEEFMLECLGRLVTCVRALTAGAPAAGVAYPRPFPMQMPSWERFFRVNEAGGWMRLGLVPVL